MVEFYMIKVGKYTVRPMDANYGDLFFLDFCFRFRFRDLDGEVLITGRHGHVQHNLP